MKLIRAPEERNKLHRPLDKCDHPFIAVIRNLDRRISAEQIEIASSNISYDVVFLVVVGVHCKCWLHHPAIYIQI